MFWDNFERICRTAGTTPSGACVAVGFGKNRPSNWKRTGTLPKQDELYILADYLECEIADFFKDWGTAPQGSWEAERMRRIENEAKNTPSYTDLDDYEIDMIRIYRSLSAKERAKLMTAVYEFDED